MGGGRDTKEKNPLRVMSLATGQQLLVSFVHEMIEIDLALPKTKTRYPLGFASNEERRKRPDGLPESTKSVPFFERQRMHRPMKPLGRTSHLLKGPNSPDWPLTKVLVAISSSFLALFSSVLANRRNATRR